MTRSCLLLGSLGVLLPFLDFFLLPPFCCAILGLSEKYLVDEEANGAVVVATMAADELRAAHRDNVDRAVVAAVLAIIFFQLKIRVFFSLSMLLTNLCVCRAIIVVG